jgi:hypothetical protein
MSAEFKVATDEAEAHTKPVCISQCKYDAKGRRPYSTNLSYDDNKKIKSGDEETTKNSIFHVGELTLPIRSVTSGRVGEEVSNDEFLALFEKNNDSSCLSHVFYKSFLKWEDDCSEPEFLYDHKKHFFLLTNVTSSPVNENTNTEEKATAEATKSYLSSVRLDNGLARRVFNMAKQHTVYLVVNSVVQMNRAEVNNEEYDPDDEYFPDVEYYSDEDEDYEGDENESVDSDDEDDDEEIECGDEEEDFDDEVKRVDENNGEEAKCEDVLNEEQEQSEDDSDEEENDKSSPTTSTQLCLKLDIFIDPLDVLTSDQRSDLEYLLMHFFPEQFEAQASFASDGSTSLNNTENTSNSTVDFDHVSLFELIHDLRQSKDGVISGLLTEVPTSPVVPTTQIHLNSLGKIISGINGKNEQKSVKNDQKMGKTEQNESKIKLST